MFVLTTHRLHRNGKTSKLLVPTSIPEHLSVRRRCSPEYIADDRDHQYTLYAVIEHEGHDLNCGHYTTYINAEAAHREVCHGPDSRVKWVHFSDEHVTVMKHDDMQKILSPSGVHIKTPYMVFYKRNAWVETLSVGRLSLHKIIKIRQEGSLFLFCFCLHDRGSWKRTKWKGANIKNRMEMRVSRRERTHGDEWAAYKLKDSKKRKGKQGMKQKKVVLTNFLIGQAKFPIYKSRKAKMENIAVSSPDVLLTFTALVSARLKLEHFFLIWTKI